jgi:hypothetical protein
MKPILPNYNFKTRRDSFAKAPRHLPHTDYHYHASKLADFGGRCGDGCKAARSFRKIGESYWNREARHSFVAEASFFALIIMTAAVPVLEGARALGALVRSLGVL